MKKIIPAIAAIAATTFACSDIETYDFQIPDGYVAPTHYTDDNGETYITSAAISTAAGTIDDYEYVDLGLSVKWARVNLGATSPEEFGDYYAWGEVETKDEYTQDNSVTYGDDDIEDFSGSKKYDAATANLGNAWRMPTQDEFQELIDNCQTIEYLKYNDVYGYLLTIDDGKSLFFPEAGHYSYYSDFLYWTSTPYNAKSAVEFGIRYSNAQRYLGGTIRAVTDGDSTDKSIEDILGEAPEQLYLVGLNDDWDSYDIKLTPTDNEFEYQGIAAVSSCSSGFAIYVEEDNDFKTFSSDTGKDDGTIAYQGSENIPFDNTGLYIWTVDLANSSYSYTKVTSVSYTGLNNSSTLVKMTQDSENQFIYSAEIKITTASTDGIKIVLNGDRDYYLGGNSGIIEYLSTITDDIDSGTYTLTIDFSEMKYSIIDETGINIVCKINGYIYVDLGLTSGLKWAIQNVGATLPADYGKYYAWSSITIDWGSTWRNATHDEYEELMEECSMTWTTQENSEGEEINGCLMEGPNGNSIFFPAGGHYLSPSWYDINVSGNYWTSTKYVTVTSGNNYAYAANFSSEGAGYSVCFRIQRNNVRPVSY